MKIQIVTDSRAYFRDKIQKKFPDVEIGISNLGPVIGTHLGIVGIGIGII